MVEPVAAAAARLGGLGAAQGGRREEGLADIEEEVGPRCDQMLLAHWLYSSVVIVVPAAVHRVLAESCVVPPGQRARVVADGIQVVHVVQP